MAMRLVDWMRGGRRGWTDRHVAGRVPGWEVRRMNGWVKMWLLGWLGGSGMGGDVAGWAAGGVVGGEVGQIDILLSRCHAR